jgi:exopolyphosphatase/guanosine-5'-triphosphate,3'-diphosphate pyrophosphatase
MRVCAIDVGTNTVQSLVADVTAAGGLTVVADEERFARLGQGVDASKQLAPEAMDRAVACLRAALDTATRHGAERVVIGATSASRDASNVGVLVARVRDELGLDYRVLPGEAEAALSFRGALARWPDAPAGPVAVVDIGGGSTEVALGTRAGGVASRTSLDVGSVRLSERRFSARPPSPAEAEAARADVVRAFAAVPASVAAAVAEGAPVVATGSVARVLAGLAGFGVAEGAPPPRVPADVVASWSARLLGLTPAETLALDPAALAGREDVVAASVLVLDTVLGLLGAGAYVTTRGGLRHGLALAEASPS